MLTCTMPAAFRQQNQSNQLLHTHTRARAHALGDTRVPALIVQHNSEFHPSKKLLNPQSIKVISSSTNITSGCRQLLIRFRRTVDWFFELNSKLFKAFLILSRKKNNSRPRTMIFFIQSRIKASLSSRRDLNARLERERHYSLLHLSYVAAIRCEMQNFVIRPKNHQKKKHKPLLAKFSDRWLQDCDSLRQLLSNGGASSLGITLLQHSSSSGAATVQTHTQYQPDSRGGLVVIKRSPDYTRAADSFYVFSLKITAMRSFGNALHTITAVPESTQPSAPCGTVK